MLDFEQRLGLSRRIDWRFLLPEPALADVACLGPADEQLLSALSCFSESLTVIAADDGSDRETRPAADGNGTHKNGNGTQGRHEQPSDAGRHHDLVVACAGSRTGIEQAAALVRPGGFLYVEASPQPAERQRRKSAKAGSRQALRRPNDYVSLLSQLGFSHVRLHWHWPNFSECTAIVPLDDRTALLHFLDKQGSKPGQPYKSFLAKCLFASRLLGLFVRNFSVIGMRPVV